MLQLPHRKLSHPSLKHILFGGLGSSVGLLGIMLSVALYVVEKLTHPKKRGTFDEYTISPYELELPAEAVLFPSLRGKHQVSGWYIPHPQATSTVLLCPGYRTGKVEVLGMCAHLWKAGHNVLAFEYYGHGIAVGTSVTLGYREMHDFLGAVAYAKERAPQSRLGVLAYSMGAAIAIMCSAQSNDVEVLVCDSAFATHRSVVDYNVRRVLHIFSAPFVWFVDLLMGWRAGYHFSQVEPIREIGRIAPRPILLIHGLKDSMVDPHDATLLFEAANEPKEVWLIPDADHCGSYFSDRSAYATKVVTFFDKHLKRPRLHLVEKMVADVGAQSSPLAASAPVSMMEHREIIGVREIERVSLSEAS